MIQTNQKTWKIKLSLKSKTKLRKMRNKFLNIKTAVFFVIVRHITKVKIAPIICLTKHEKIVCTRWTDVSIVPFQDLNVYVLRNDRQCFAKSVFQ